MSALQLTWPGIASIYYGTEAGLTGHDDPDDRRPYPWDAVDTELRDWYRALGQLRADHEALRTATWSSSPPMTRTARWRSSAARTTEAAITILNLGDTTRSGIAIDLAGRVPDGTVLTDGIGGITATVADGAITIDLAAHGAAVFITPAGHGPDGAGRPGRRSPRRRRAAACSWPGTARGRGRRLPGLALDPQRRRLRARRDDDLDHVR